MDKDALAPGGVLRVALNHANFLLVTRPASDAVGVAPDLARALAERISASVTFVGYATAGHVADAASRDEWDVAFIGADRAREGEVCFTEPYVEIDATYLVAPHASLTQLDQVDRPGVQIAVAARSAYDLFLRRHLASATLVDAAGLPESEALFIAEHLDVLAGLRPHLLQVQERYPDTRLLGGRFMAVQQAIGVPRRREEQLPLVAAFARDVLASGLVAALIARHGVRGLSIPGA